MLRGDLANVSRADGWEAWRRREADQLADLMRRRIDFLQNPADCATAKKVVCNLNKVGAGNGAAQICSRREAFALVRSRHWHKCD